MQLKFKKYLEDIFSEKSLYLIKEKIQMKKLIQTIKFI